LLKRSKFRTFIILLTVMMLVLAPVAGVYGQSGSTGFVQDNELVVTQLGDNGQIESIQVLNNLHIIGGGVSTIEDGKNYSITSVRNLYSTQKIEQKDNSLSLKTTVKGASSSEDIYYLASIDKKEIPRIKMPVSVQVDYYLNGKKVKPSSIYGKSGHLKIVCNLENTTGVEREVEYQDSKGNLAKTKATVFTPYVVSLSGWEFDNRKFSNIKAPGIAGESPEGVIVNVQGTTQVNWSVPLVPPKYPAKQYTVLEADGKNMELPSFKIVVIPIVPTTSEVDNIPTIHESFLKLYDGFDQIQNGIGAREQDATVLFGLGAVKDGMGQLSGGLGNLIDKMKMIRFGIANPAFNASTYNEVKGVDANGNSPGVRDAVGLLKAGVQERALPAYKLQALILGTLGDSIGKTPDAAQEPNANTSIMNDMAYLKSQVPAPQQKIISDNIEPKLNRLANNIKVFSDGGNMVTSSGSMAFPASVKALEEGSAATLDALKKIDGGLAMMELGMGAVDKNGKPVKVMMNGQPGSILYALAYMQESIDGQMVPGITQLQEGAGQIGTGAATAKEAISGGLETFESVPAIVSALEENASQADTFLGKPAGASGTVAYVFQTPEVSKEAHTMKYGLGVVAVVLILLIVMGRPPKQAFEASVEHA
jgi:X-X-X-Leu-X-X-Gly heptad repeat protein